MPRTDIGPIRTDSSVVKTEGKNRYSRDEGNAPANIGELEVGTVMVRAADGGLTVLPAPTATAGAAGANANCVLLENIEAGNAAKRVVVLTRHAEVVRQELRFPAAYPAAEVDAAIASLRDLGIIVRRGV